MTFNLLPDFNLNLNLINKEHEDNGQNLKQKSKNNNNNNNYDCNYNYNSQNKVIKLKNNSSKSNIPKTTRKYKFSTNLKNYHKLKNKHKSEKDYINYRIKNTYAAKKCRLKSKMIKWLNEAAKHNEKIFG